MAMDVMILMNDNDADEEVGGWSADPETPIFLHGTNTGLQGSAAFLMASP